MLILGDARAIPMRDDCVQCVVTSPPYFGLRDYGIAGQIGLELTPDAYVVQIVAVFREVRRVLKDDGVCWLNLGDSYASGGRKTRDLGRSKLHPAFNGEAYRDGLRPDDPEGVKPKDLLGIPWRVAFALQADGWYLRSDIIWHKPNPMPESVTDRPTRAHEYVFLLTKSPKYYYDHEAIKTPYAASTLTQFNVAYAGIATKDYAAHGVQNPSAIKKRITDKQRGHGRRHAGFNDRWDAMPKSEQQQDGANKRSVWTVSAKPYKGAHFATMPEALVEPCIKAGSRLGDIILDPFMGSGTVGSVAKRLGRRWVGLDLNPMYHKLAKERIGLTCSYGEPMLGRHPLCAAQTARVCGLDVSEVPVPDYSQYAKGSNHEEPESAPAPRPGWLF